MLKPYFLLFLCLCGIAAQAQLFDSTWALNGYTQDPNFRDESMAMVIQTDGKVVAGVNRGLNQTGYDDLYTCRYKTNGTLDSSYGTNGIAGVWIGDKAKTRDLDIQPDGKIVAIGQATYCVDIVCGMDNLVLARFKSNGQPDSSFGTNGKVLSEYVFGNSVMSALGMRVKVLSTGKILASGLYIFQTASMNTERHAFVARFNSDGTLDNTFGTGGKVLLGKYVVSDPYYDNLEDMAVDNSGNIFCTGTAYYPGTGLANPADAYVVKLTPDGSPDNSFGNSGEVLLDKAAKDQPHALALRADGKLFLAGNCGASSLDSPRAGAIYVINAGDGSYASDIPGGFRKINPGNGYSSEIYSMLLQPDNRIVVSGIADSGSLRAGLVARYNPDATEDLSFTGQAGHAFYRLSTNLQWATPLYCVKQTGNGRLLVAGNRTVAGYGPTVLLMRLKPGTPSPNGIGGGAAAAMAEASVFPNPVTERSVFRFTLPHSCTVSVWLTDIEGKTVGSYVKQVWLDAGTHSVSLDNITLLPKGIYMLSMESSGGIYYRQKLQL